MNEPLYCFKLDDVTGRITKYTIRDYEYKNVGYRKFYKFRADLGSHDYVYCVRQENLDKFVTMKLFSFNPSSKEAITKIKNTLNNKKIIAKRDMNRYDKMITMIDKENEF